MPDDEPQVTVFPWGIEGAPGRPPGQPTAVVTHRGYRLELRFADGDNFGEGNVQEIRVLPDGEELTPRVLRRLAPDSDTYLAFARSAMRIFGDPAEMTPQERWERFRASTDALRALGGPGRGYPPEFYARISTTYRAIVDGGEPHPVKALAEKHHVTISAASRWIKETRRRGLLPEKEARDAS